MKRRYLIGLATFAAILTGCAAQPATTPSSAGTAEVEKVTVGVGPASYSLAVTPEFFDSTAIKLEKYQTSSPAEVIPLLLNGQIQIAAADPVGAMIAMSQGVPLVMIGVATWSGTDTTNDVSGLLVNPEMGITNGADLNGATIGMSAVGGSAQLSAAASIDELGGDSSTVSFVEVAPQSMIASVSDGTIDAAVTQEPSLTLARGAGLETLFSPAGTAYPESPLIVYMTTRDYLAEHQGTVDAFLDGLAQASEGVEADHDAARAFSQEQYKLTPEQAQEMILPTFSPTAIDPDEIDKVQKLMIKYGLLDSEVDLETAVYTRK